VGHVHAKPASIPHSRNELLASIADTEHDPLNTVGMKQPQLMDDERLTIDVEQRFRHTLGQWAQSRGQPTCQNCHRKQLLVHDCAIT
jgi:hypothetical protein